MMKMKIQSMQGLKKEMLSVARGERKAPADAAQATFESVEAVIRLLTPENCFLLATIDQKNHIRGRSGETGAAHGTECQPHIRQA